MELAWIDGNVLPLKDARVPVSDRSYLYGDGAFETLALVRGRLVWKRSHLERLARTLSWLGLEVKETCARADEALTALETAVSFAQGRARVTVSRAGRYGDFGADSACNVTAMLTPCELFAAPPAYLASVIRADAEIHAHKLTSYMPSLIGMRAVKRHEDPLFINPQRQVRESATANVFFVVDGELWTPPATHVLPGVTRQHVIHCAEQIGMHVKEGEFTLQEIQGRTQAAFLTSSLAGVRPVRQVDDALLPESDVLPAIQTRLSVLINA